MQDILRDQDKFDAGVDQVEFQKEIEIAEVISLMRRFY